MKTTLLILSFFLVGNAFANDPTDSLQQIEEQLRQLDSIDKKLHYKTGRLSLADNKVVINVPEHFKFLDAKEARYVLEELWGNLKGQTALGMLVPKDEMAAIANYAFVVEYDEMGYVKDDDAQDINYNELLAELKKDAIESNKEREAQGVSSLFLVGWASAPFYDKERNVLHWAKEFSTPESESNTLNYDVRVLGRHGVLILQAVSSMDHLDSVKQNINPLLGSVAFTDGNRYADFNESTDNVAAWTIGGLVAGKMLAKAGFFAFIGKFLKIIVLGAIALGGAVVKYFRNRKSNPEPVPAYENTEAEQVS
jgi:uncharacterized membrane-anchored protein